MANAIASVNGVGYIEDIGVTIDLNTCYLGEDVPGQSLSTPVQVVIDPASTAAQIMDTMRAAVAQVGADNGLDVAVADMILPAFDRAE